MGENMRVLVSGGGIAGPALAFWLRRYGIAATVIERAAGLRPGGHAVDVRGVARGVVETMGLMPDVLAHRVDERGFALIDGRGRRMAEMPVELFGGEGIAAEVEISRGDLSRVLYDATADVVEYRFGDRLVELRQDDRGVDVTFAGGTSDRFDVVVGADGVHSGVRSLAFGPDSEFVRFLGAYTAYFTVPDPGDLDHWFLMYNAPGGRVAGLRPERGGTAKASLTFRSPRPVDDPRGALTGRLAGAGWRVPELLAAMPTAPDFYCDSISQVRVDRWWRGRVVLLGDAGYCGSPLTGMGTSMALVGAYVLAGELAAAPSDPAAAFAAYQRTMGDYVAAGVQLPPGGVAAFAPRTHAMIRLRALSMRAMHHWPMRAVFARQFTKADAITLPDYPARATSPAPRDQR
jgi:2-polyprenyl-6-methoxyphenol hydroxylase-like FAD-dependent oxidoreductase